MRESPPELLGDLLRATAEGSPPPADGAVTVLPQPPGPVAAVLAFANHHVVAADVEPGWVHRRLAPGDMSAPVGPAFVAELTELLGVAPDNLDVTFAAAGTGTGAADLVVPVPLDTTHPRVARSVRYRTDVEVHATPDGAGLLILGRGLAGRREVAFEVDPAARGRGIGRALATAAADMTPAGEPLFAAVAPGNVPSLRAVLATGRYRPIGGELLFPVGTAGRPAT